MTGQRLLQVDSGVKLQCNVLKKDIEAMSAEVQRFQEVLTAQHGELMQNIIACLEFAQDAGASAPEGPNGSASSSNTAEKHLAKQAPPNSGWARQDSAQAHMQPSPCRASSWSK